MIRFLYLLVLFTNLTLAKSNEYQLGPGDEIEIFVYQESELKTLTKLSQSGQVDLPLVGQIKL